MTAANLLSCGWLSGTARTGPRDCGRPVRATAVTLTGEMVPVCGIHARTAARQGATVTPLAREAANPASKEN